jgi:hypothetical protein
VRKGIFGVSDAHCNFYKLWLHESRWDASWSISSSTKVSVAKFAKLTDFYKNELNASIRILT